MAGLHDPEPEIGRIPLDMEAIAKAASSREWLLEFDHRGDPFTWSGKATSKAAAEHQARAQLAERHEGFNRYKATLTRAVEGGR
jgi:hypothetical protein